MTCRLDLTQFGGDGRFEVINGLEARDLGH